MSVQDADPGLGARPLLLPEIVHAVCEHLPKPALAVAARLNRLWFSCATDALWWCQDSLDPLLRLWPERRQLYASKIGVLRVHNPDALDAAHHITGQLGFPILQQVVFGNHADSEACRNESMFPFLTPELKKLTLIKCRPTTALFRKLRLDCSSLQMLHLYPTVANNGVDESYCLVEEPWDLDDDAPFTAWEQDPRADAFVSLLKHLPQLRHLNLDFGTSSLATRQCFIQCARMSSLETLFIRLPIPTVWLRQATSMSPAAFPSLRRLQIGLSSEAVLHAETLLQNLCRVTLVIQDATTQIFPCLARLAGIQHLGVIFPRQTHITSTDIVSLGALSKMESLKLAYCNVFQQDLKDAELIVLSQAEMEGLLSRLPSLQQLHFNLPCQFNYNILLTMADHAPRLRAFSLLHTPLSDILGLFHQPQPLFPELHTLQTIVIEPPEGDYL